MLPVFASSRLKRRTVSITESGWPDVEKSAPCSQMTFENNLNEWPGAEVSWPDTCMPFGNPGELWA